MDRPRRDATLVFILAGILLAVHAGLAWHLRAPAITTRQDDAMYLLLARGLPHLSYHQVWNVHSPPESQYPPLYPAVLALLGALSSKLGAALALNVLCSTLALGVLFALARRWSPVVDVSGANSSAADAAARAALAGSPLAVSANVRKCPAPPA